MAIASFWFEHCSRGESKTDLIVIKIKNGIKVADECVTENPHCIAILVNRVTWREVIGQAVKQRSESY